MKKQKNRGITLVALIITIIVMLILVAVTVTVVVDSDIIGQAEQAGELYKDAYEQENVGNITIGDKEYSSLTEYIQSQCIHSYGTDGICTKCGKKEDLIEFKISDKEYTAKRGMTFGEWVSSDYCTDNFKFYDLFHLEYKGNSLALVDGDNICMVYRASQYNWLFMGERSVITESMNYSLSVPGDFNLITFSINDVSFSTVSGDIDQMVLMYNFLDSPLNTFGLMYDTDSQMGDITTRDGSLLYTSGTSSFPADASTSIYDGDQFIIVAPST